jgi:hypothetical protein
MSLNPAVKIKRKSINALFDYCLENKIEITVKPLQNDEFEVEFNLSDVTKAILLGMFLREMKLELIGVAIAAPAPKAKKPEVKEAVKEEASVPATSMVFEEEKLQLDLEAVS